MATVVKVSVDTTDIRNLVKKMESKQAAYAISRGLNDSLKQGRSEAYRQVRGRYNLPLFEITRNKAVTLRAARAANLDARLYANVKRSIRLTRFRGVTGDFQRVKRRRVKGGGIQTKLIRGGKEFDSVTRQKKRKETKVKVLKSGQKRVIRGGFLGRTKSGHVSVFGRSVNSKGYKNGDFQWRNKRVNKTGADLPIAALTSFTPHKALSNKNIEEKVISKMESAVPRRTKYWVERVFQKQK